MAHAHRHAGDLIASTHIFGEGGHGVLGSEVPSTGLAGPALLYNDLSLPAEASNEFRALIASIPAGGTFFAYEDSSFSAIGYADGTYFGSYQGFKDGVSYGSASFSFTVGATPATVITPGTATLTLVGFTPKLSAGIAVAAATATFAATFQDARFLRGRKMPAATATYVSTFPAARTLRGRKMAAATAGYAATFQAAALLRGLPQRVLNADAASFVSTFGVARQSFRLPAVPAAFTWTATAARLLRGRTVAATTAAFQATFTDAVFSRAKRMPAVPVAFATTFNSVTLSKGTVHGEPSLSRRFVVTADHHGKHKSDYFDIRPRPQIPKDPNATLDYTWDWSLWLADGGDAITDYTITLTNGLAVVTSQNNNGLITVWVSGGTVGKVAKLTCRLSTSSGRVDDRTLYLQIRDR